ncbi:sugar ABC transporter ATP-binding protein [Lachnospiraceae bacterium 54-53]
MDYVLEMKDIFKSFPGVKVLDGVTLCVRPGEVHALMGENGAGKSTLMKILMGIYKADSGTILLDQKAAVIHGPKDAMNKGISMIHQELNTLLDMEVSENIFLGREILKEGLEKFRIIDQSKMREEAKKYFDEMKINIDPKALMRTLSVAQMQLVEIVKAISLNSKIIIMDEPTSAITEKETAVLFQQIEKLKKKGVAILYISHKMEEIFKIADTITVLRDGEWMGTKPSKELDDNSLIKLMVGREITEIYPKEKAEITDTILEVKNLSRGTKVRNVSFQVRKGEVLGIAGLVGAGRSELAETIFGLYQKTHGEVRINGQKTEIKNPGQAIRNKIALITEDRKLTGLNLKASVKNNISLVSIRDLSKAGIVDKNKENRVAEQYIKELKIKTPSKNSLVCNLSGGNQQKVVLAKWLLGNPDIIIFDEPTRGIDIGAKREIYLLISKLAKEGKAVIVISSEMSEIMGISDRILVMCEGKLTGEVPRDQFSQEKILSYASNMEDRKKDENKRAL